MKRFVHYDPTSLRIIQDNVGLDLVERPGLAIAELPGNTPLGITDDTHRIDPETLTVLPRPGAFSWGQALTVEAVRILRNGELIVTDAFMVPDRPISSELREAWATYRQALRDLPDAGDAAAMVAAWPIRPDGIDAVIHLRTD
ncbi:MULTISPECIES: phage tail assembly chaperone [unclassified Chelatococcus]|uniref:phage tail assembly chaperone n=1 Tax=unclassified Chelatococcus TaxID=2638111 RepID=UPI001BCC7F9D|nr:MULTISPECIES: phage tail assembly chaperone [unclassified Chelatococcus]MBS7698780.1 hypothetical protein [Chelatococcus sp. YT9]MBX3554638.1 hypothetical protein [Chelatococcus sp.]